MYKKNKGITLISLIVTIIIILIIAGIAVSFLTGENGILNKAKNAKEAHAYAEAKEILEIELTNKLAQNQGKTDLALIDNLNLDGYNVSNTLAGKIITMTKNNETYNFFVDQNFHVMELNSAQGTSSYGGSGNSTDISNFNIEISEVNGTSMKITVKNLTTASGNPVYGYMYLLNGVIAKYSNNPEERLTGLTVNKEYDVSVIAIDINGYTKFSNSLKQKTLNIAEYQYTGSYQTFTASVDGTYFVECWGASGGNRSSLYHGGYGGYTSGYINLTAGTKLYIYVGEKGSDDPSVVNGGWNGGGNCAAGKDADARPGGGATDIRIAATSSQSIWNEFNSLASRIMVAAGGGGGVSENLAATWSATGGAAGGLNGYIPTNIGGSSSGYYATGATQTAAGHVINSATTGLGKFGLGGTGTTTDGGTGGGGGWYGGGGSSVCGGGAGGSSYISGHNGCNSIAAGSTESNITHTGLATHSLGYVFNSTKIIDGKGYNWTSAIGSYIGMPSIDGTTTMEGNTGNGYCKISYQ